MAAKCIGFGEKEGECGNKVDWRISEYWCPLCEKARVKHITARLMELAKRMGLDEQE